MWAFSFAANRFAVAADASVPDTKVMPSRSASLSMAESETVGTGLVAVCRTAEEVLVTMVRVVVLALLFPFLVGDKGAASTSWSPRTVFADAAVWPTMDLWDEGGTGGFS